MHTNAQGYWTVGNHPCSDLQIRDQRVWTTQKFYLPGEQGHGHLFDTMQAGPFVIIVMYGYIPALHLSPTKPYHDLRQDQRLLNSIKVMLFDMVVVSHPNPLGTCCDLYNTLFPRWHRFEQKSIPLSPLSVSRCENNPPYSSYDQKASYWNSFITVGQRNDCTGKLSFDIAKLILQHETEIDSNMANCAPITEEGEGAQNTEQNPSESGSGNLVEIHSDKIVVTNKAGGQCKAKIEACGHTLAVKDGQVFVNPSEWDDMPVDHGAEALNNAADKLREEADRLLNTWGGDDEDLEEMEVEEDFLYKTLKYFEEWWLDTIKTYQSGLLPVALINTEAVKHWFEFLYDSVSPALSRYRCWLCNAFWDLAMLSPVYKPAIAQNEGKLRSNYKNNWQDILEHTDNEGHIYLNKMAEKEGVKTKEEFKEVLYRKHSSGELLEAQNNQFLTAHKEAQLGMSYGSHVGLTDLQTENGCNMGRLHRTPDGSKIERLSMCKRYRNDLKSFLHHYNGPVGVMLDESVDASHKSQMIVYIQGVESNRPMLWYYRTIQITDATAEGLFQALIGAWRDDGLYDFFKANLLSIATDGASTLTGLRGGLHTLLDNWADHDLVKTKCMAHKLNLSVKWGIGKFEHFVFLEKTVNRHHGFYKGNAGHKRYDHLMKTALELGLYLYSPSYVFEVRWSSSETWAFEVILRNYEIIVDDLSAIMNDPTTTFSASDKKQASELLVTFLSRRFMLLLQFAQDIFDLISIWSKRLQESNGLLFDKLRQRDDILTKLEALKTPTPGSGETRTGKFLNQVKCWGRIPYAGSYYDMIRGSVCHEHQFHEVEHVEWRGRQLSDLDFELVDLPKLVDVRNSTIQSLQDQIMEYFPEESLLRSLSVLDPSQFPNNIVELNSYSDQTVDAILLIGESLGYQEQLPHLAENWEYLLSSIMTHSTQSEYLEDKEAGPMLFWEKYLNKPYFRDSLKMVIQATLVLSIGSSECERGFSIMNRLKPKDRSLIDNVGLDCDMFLNINGPRFLKDVPKDLFSLDFYHAGHSLADDPIHKTTSGEGSRGGKKKKDPRYMQGGSAIFKKGDSLTYGQRLKEKFEKILAGEPLSYD